MLLWLLINPLNYRNENRQSLVSVLTQKMALVLLKRTTLGLPFFCRAGVQGICKGVILTPLYRMDTFVYRDENLILQHVIAEVLLSKSIVIDNSQTLCFKLSNIFLFQHNCPSTDSAAHFLR